MALWLLLLTFSLDEKVSKESLPVCRGQAGRQNPACTAVSAGREVATRPAEPQALWRCRRYGTGACGNHWDWVLEKFPHRLGLQ